MPAKFRWDIVHDDGGINDPLAVGDGVPTCKPEYKHRYACGWFTSFLYYQGLEYNIRSSPPPNEACVYDIQTYGLPMQILNERPFWKEMSPEALAVIRSGRGKLILFIAYEGFSLTDMGFFHRLHAVLEESGIPPSGVLLVFGDMLIEKRYETFVADNSIKDPIHVCAYSIFEDVARSHAREEPSNRPFQEKAASCLSRKKVYLCLNRRQRMHRSVTLCLLMEGGKIPDGLISMGPVNRKRFIEEVSWFFKGVPTSEDVVAHAHKMADTFPWVLDIPDLVNTNPAQMKDCCPDHYLDTYFSLITETLFEDDVLFLSEKVWKPMNNMHPFICVGNKGVMQELTNRGYRTFSPMINEWYDSEGDFFMRLTSALTSLAKIMAQVNFKSREKKIIDLYQALLPVMWHNADHLRRPGIAPDAQRVLDKIDAMCASTP